ncbi:hypothetical protein C882_1845 [Caenispirillum salinarum AK4]|uniref:Uncharacterized protein n=1 Tax=Caenispirillum salinarum AK4 TaxID=1238182 RepID=K9H9Q0_9PROT|nr:hypothetical protein C882_1845 [Caenispirillum salinarum AK4]
MAVAEYRTPLRYPERGDARSYKNQTPVQAHGCFLRYCRKPRGLPHFSARSPRTRPGPWSQHCVPMVSPLRY